MYRQSPLWGSFTYINKYYHKLSELPFILPKTYLCVLKTQKPPPPLLFPTKLGMQVLSSDHLFELFITELSCGTHCAGVKNLSFLSNVSFVSLICKSSATEPKKVPEKFSSPTPSSRFYCKLNKPEANH